MEHPEEKNTPQNEELIKIEDLPMLEDISQKEQKGILGGRGLGLDLDLDNPLRG